MSIPIFTLLPLVPMESLVKHSWREFLHCSVGEDLTEADYTNRRKIDNDFWQDDEAMKDGNYTGITRNTQSRYRHVD
jgi:hypothetical protein